MTISKPIIRKIEGTREALESFESQISLIENDKAKEILTSFPTVYIHNWKNTDTYDVYIGESNNVFQRTRQHFELGDSDESSWQNKMLSSNASLYIIGHDHFNYIWQEFPLLRECAP